MIRFIGLAVTILALALAAPTPACGPILGLQPAPTLRVQMAEARLVIYGTLANARPGDGTNGFTDLHVERVFKTDPFLGDRKVLELPRYLPLDGKEPKNLLVFCDIYKGKLDPYWGVRVKSAAALRYLEPLIADPKKCDYRYFFDHLEDEEPLVADDALGEFVRADYRDVFPLAKNLPADRLAGWLKDARKPENATDKDRARMRLYAILLGDCGSAAHAKMMRDQFESSASKSSEGMLIGYTLLKPRAGLALLREQFNSPKTELSIRLSALQAARFLLDFRTDRVERGPIFEAIACMLEHKDVADLAIEELRRRGCREKTEQILRVFQEDHLAPVTRRAVVRYALSCPKDPRAVKFLLRIRRLDQQLVSDVEESLQFERLGLE